MTASQLISELQDLVKEFGDREIEVNGECDSCCPINTCSRLEITQIELFDDSSNFQLIIDNSMDV